MDFRLRTLLYPKTYFWIDVFLLKETQKAILIKFNGKKAWLPKAWIRRIKRNKNILRHCGRSEAISIKISQYHWEKKFY
ncbi:MAG: hypothetical protein COW92_01660 [Candidatus Omnitrophica bacterium CG22_combo_CG10-13_8_21_14_all_43_16]|nr:MAG: hypothetical protein COW92_01660 [Candidatus Omnitrophica bacterium CG22_combo_CG10-13_8_21_14_all_43_16]